MVYEIAASAGGLNTLTLLAFLSVLLAFLWLFLIWPMRIANDIGLSKGRTGWAYPLVGFFLGGGALGAWLGVLLVKALPPVPGFFPSSEPLYMPPPDRTLFRDETQRAPAMAPRKQEAYVPPKRCPVCKGLVPLESPICGSCGHSFERRPSPVEKR